MSMTPEFKRGQMQASDGKTYRYTVPHTMTTEQIRATVECHAEYQRRLESGQATLGDILIGTYIDLHWVRLTSDAMPGYPEGTRGFVDLHDHTGRTTVILETGDPVELPSLSLVIGFSFEPTACATEEGAK